MIPISGVLVFVAAGLLVDGVFFTGSTPGTPWQIWASIVVSALAAVLLVAGAVRERGRRPVAESADAAHAPTPTGIGTGDIRIPAPSAPLAEPAGQPLSSPPVAGLPAPVAPPAAPAAAPGLGTAGQVLVVPGRPRYHLAGCRYVTEREAQPLDLAEARAAGYTACGVCQPDELIAATSGDDDQVLAEELAVVEREATPPSGGPSAAVPSPPSGPPPATPAPVGGETGGERSADPVVLVRNRYHRPDCRYVAVAAERRETTRGEARDEGALPCGVCRP